MRSMVVSLFVLLCACSSVPLRDTTGAFPQKWIDGTAAAEPRLQVQRYDRDTFVIRQSLLTHFEAPFIYLLFGRDRALLLDTGAGNIALRPTVDRLIEEWRKANGGRPISLIVAHSHAHDDHIAGDGEFAGRANTQIVGTSPLAVATFFRLTPWPEKTSALELGDRALDVIATPGHENSHIMFYDRRTGILLSGDALYPGRLYFRRADLPVYRASIHRLVHVLKDRKINWIMGAHIELDKAGVQFPAKTVAHTNERPLELPASALRTLLDRLNRTNEQAGAVNAGEFILFPY